MTLISFASRQIWPQVLAVLHKQPDRLVLFHTDEEAESLRPATRLATFFSEAGLLRPPIIECRRVPHDRYQEIKEALASLSEESTLDDLNCSLLLTGGNKLMAMAAAEWCRHAEVPCFYLERDLRVFPFEPRDCELEPRPDYPLDPHLARDIDPLHLLRCQLDGADIVRPGQRLTLAESARGLHEQDVQQRLKQGFDFRKLLLGDFTAETNKAGDPLEYATAFVLLYLGVPVVRRSIQLQSRGLKPIGRDEGELDLVFNWAGKLWLVDCKDRHSAKDKVDRLRNEILKQATIDVRLNELLQKYEDEFRHRELHPLKEDLLMVSEAGGLLGRAIVVRRSALPPEAEEFARSRQLIVVGKDQLIHRLRELLLPVGESTVTRSTARSTDVKPRSR